MFCSPIDEETSRLRFLEFGEYAREIELYVYIETRDVVEYLEQCEDINLSTQGIIEASGTQPVIPTRTTYFEDSPSPEPN
ncbi:MAG: hypothetical protein WBO73_00170 [Gammaproteobacteria bacterium]